MQLEGAAHTLHLAGPEQTQGWRGDAWKRPLFTSHSASPPSFGQPLSRQQPLEGSLAGMASPWQELSFLLLQQSARTLHLLSLNRQKLLESKPGFSVFSVIRGLAHSPGHQADQ